jgi:hypothetical protein
MPQLPNISGAVARELANILGVAHESWMQDWPIEVADPNRLDDFITHYEEESREDFRLATMTLVFASLDEAFSQGQPDTHALGRIDALLHRDSDILRPLVLYWSCPDADSTDEMYPLTPWLRQL